MIQTTELICLLKYLLQQVEKLDDKLDKLLDFHLEENISKEEYLEKKNKIFNEKLNLQEKIKEINSKGNNWLEPLRDFIYWLKQNKKTAINSDLNEIKTFLKKIGSNFILKDKKVEFSASFLWEIARRWRAFPNSQGMKELNPH